MPPITPETMKAALRSAAGKRQFNEVHFDEAATQYDRATRALSLGRDRVWKQRLLAQLPPHPAPTCVDLACGTGDLSFGLAQRYPQGQILGLDLSTVMLDFARQRNQETRIRFTQGDMCHTELPTASVDIVTGGYALRNAPDLEQALIEINRIMKPGATAAFLDFSKTPNRLGQVAGYTLLKLWGSFWGWVLHRNITIHGYISESLRGFPDRRRLLALIRHLGFVEIREQRHFGGLTATLTWQKPQAVPTRD